MLHTQQRSHSSISSMESSHILLAKLVDISIFVLTICCIVGLDQMASGIQYVSNDANRARIDVHGVSI